MSIPSSAEVRRLVGEAADVVTEHPTKSPRAREALGLPALRHSDGTVVDPPWRGKCFVYFEGSDTEACVGGSFDGVFLVARGKDHDESVWGLAYALGLITIDVGVEVVEVDPGTFWTYCLPKE